MRILFAICLLLAITASPLARADLDTSDRTELNKIIEDFIRNNPEVVRDALIGLAAREEAERKQAGFAKVRDDVGDPVMGNPNGNITLYEFSDYNCGYCKRVFEPIQQLVRDNPMSDSDQGISYFKPIVTGCRQAAIAAEMQGNWRLSHCHDDLSRSDH